MLTQDFEGTFPPTGWSSSSVGSVDCPWLSSADYPLPQLDPSVGLGAAADSDTCGESGIPANSIDTSLVSPTFDLSGFTDAQLDFDMAYRHLSSSRVDVDVSTDGGTNWTLLTSYNTASVGSNPFFPQPQTFDLSAYDGESSVTLRWRFVADWDWWVYVDNVEVTAVGGGGGDGIDLVVGLALDDGNPSQCGTATDLTVTVGDEINFCYTVTNNSADTLEFHTLEDSVDGNIFTNMPQTIAPGGNFQFNRIVIADVSAAYEATWTAATALPGYLPDDEAPYAFVDISGTGTGLGLEDDEEIGVTIPFPFEFYGVSSDQVCVSNNGGIVFGTATCDLPFTNAALPVTSQGPLILPFWDDMDDETGNVFHQTTGTAPDRQFIVQWHERPHFINPQPPTPDTTTYQLILFEGSNEILFQYEDLNFSNPEWDNGATATVGLQNAAGAVVNQYSFNTAVLADEMAILWTTVTPITYSDTASVSLDVGAPVITVDPTEINAAADPGSSTTATLTIGNDGDRDLDWSIDESERGPRAHFPATPRQVVHKDPAGQTAQADPMLAEVAAKPAALARASRSHVLPTGTQAVPAYTTTGFGIIQYVNLDALVPGTLNTIVDPPPRNVYAQDFIDNDFSQHFFISSGGTGATLPPDTYGYIDTANGAVTQLGTVTGGVAGATWTSASWDASDGTLYASSNATGVGNQLYTVDPDTGAASLVGAITGPGVNPGAIVIAIAVSPDGQMYAVEIIDDVLLAVDKTTGAAAVIGPTGVPANFAQDMDFDDGTGILYWASYIGSGDTRMQTVDTATGDATEIGIIGNQAELLSFSIAIPSGGCSAPEDIPWLSVSPASGTIVPGAPDTDVTVTLDATGLTDGFYRANLCVSSNDPDNGLIPVPVEFAVGDPPAEEADLGISLADVPDPAQAGGALDFLATVANFGPQTVDEVTVEVELPAELTFVSGRLVQGSGSWSCSAAGSTVTCELVDGSLPVGSFAAVLEIATEVDADATPGTVETNATVTSTQWPDPNTANDIDTETTTIEGDEDGIFANSFECDDSLPGCDGGGTPGVYTDRDEFLANVQPGFYEEDFADVPGGAGGPSMSFSGNGFAYTVTATGAGTNELFNDPGLISHDSAVDMLVITFTGDPVTAVGGNFWASDIAFVPTGTDITITLSDGTVETYTSTGPTDFRGFVTPAPITSITIDAPDVPVNAWSTMDNLIVGQ